MRFDDLLRLGKCIEKFDTTAAMPSSEGFCAEKETWPIQRSGRDCKERAERKIKTNTLIFFASCVSSKLLWQVDRLKLEQLVM